VYDPGDGVGSPLAAPESRRSGIQVVARVADVLRALAAAPDGLSLSELALSVEMPKSTVHRLISALESEEFVAPASSGRLRLGRGIARLGAATRDSLRDQIRPFLLRLHEQLEETVDLSVPDGACARFVDQISAPHRLRAVSAVGAAFPLHCTANGKALLAAMPKDELIAAVPARLPALTPETITSRKELWEVLDRVRADGVAYDREEHTLGICAVGAVVRDPYRVVAAISVPVPAQRFAGNEAELARALLDVCGECSRQLGDLSATPQPEARSS
jgi:DNA-binding IclR family transcriptional regulator